MNLTKGKCPKCENYGELVFSNNPIVEPICTSCVSQELDLNNLEHADFFCRTYNIPFDPNKGTKMLQRDPENIIKIYTRQFLSENRENLYYQTSTQDLWKKANEEGEKTQKHEELLEKIQPIKKDFINRGIVKWGAGYSFTELIQLENLFTSTISTFDINNPMQIDIIKKACKLSIMIDNAISSSEVKDIKELSNAHSQLMKMAQIDEMIESSQSDVIRTVADLVQHLEDRGFEFDWNDNIERDVYDKTINVIKDYLRTLVLQSTGLEQTIEMIHQKMLEVNQDELEELAESKMPLDEVLRRAKETREKEINAELEDDEIWDDDE